MEVLDSQTNLHEPTQDLLLGKVAAALFCSLYAVREVPSFRVLHNDVQFPLGSAVDFLEADDVVMLEQLQDLGLLHGCILLGRRQLVEVDLLDHPKIATRDLFHQKCTTVRPASQQLDSLVDVCLFLDRMVLGILHSTRVL